MNSMYVMQANVYTVQRVLFTKENLGELANLENSPNLSTVIC